MNPKILIIGDSFLDYYLYCKYRKKNPEADGSVYNIEHELYHLGGAAAVAMMCSNLGATVDLASVIGMDSAGKILNELCYAHKIFGLIKSADHYTTHKTRLVVEDHLYPNRFDHEVITPIFDDIADKIIARSKQSDIILISDYGKGVVTDYLLENLPTGKLILVDPALYRSWSAYSHVDIIKANEAESIAALRDTHSTSPISTLAKTLSSIYDQSVVVTRGEIGIQYCANNGNSVGENGFIPAVSVQKKDICGAGDTVFAVLGVYLAKGYSLRQSCEYAVRYAAQQVQSFGIRSLDPIGLESITCPLMKDVD